MVRLVGALLRSVALALTLVVGVGVLLGPLFFPYRVLHVRTGSMGPELPVGAAILVTEVPVAEVAEGDVITFTDPQGSGRTITHRVVGRQDGALVTKGDAAAEPDPWLLAADDGTTAHRLAWSLPAAGHVLRVLETPGLGPAMIAWTFLASLARLLARAFWHQNPAPHRGILVPERAS
jgi:signal peptidase